MIRRLLTLCSWRAETSQLSITVKGKATVDVHESVYICPNVYSILIWDILKVIYISAWASALLVLTVMGNAKASARGTGDCQQPTLSCI